jgi:hypothetical protein
MGGRICIPSIACSPPKKISTELDAGLRRNPFLGRRRHPVTLLFDLDYLNGDHPMRAYGPLSNRLRAIHERWSTTTQPGDQASSRMQADQFRSLTTLLAVLDVCLARGERLRVR